MKKDKNLPQVDPVELKPILGMRPGLFILISGIVLILLILFCIILLPGLISDSCYIDFNINAKNVAVYDNGKYLGSSEGSVYKVEDGKHEFEFLINGIKAKKETKEIKKSLFFTLFHRHVETIDVVIENTQEIEQRAIEEFSDKAEAWSKTIDYDNQYHMPPLFSDFAYNAANLGFASISDAWLYSAMHITSDTMYDDYLRGKEILDESNIQYKSAKLTELEELLDTIYSSDIAKPKLVAKGKKSVKAVKNGDFFYYDATEVEMGNDSALLYPDVNTAPIIVDVEPFGIAATPVNEYEYSLFVEENPMWAISNKSELIKMGLVDDNYLEGIHLSTSIKSLRPIRNISYYAAKAYTEWLSAKSGKSYSLPTEAQWTVAAISSANKPYTSSLIGIDTDSSSSPSFMRGQLWEMTDSSYVPLKRITDYDKAEALSERFNNDEIIIKGGSYINVNDNIDIDTVGVTSKDSTSEFMGFRVVINE